MDKFLEKKNVIGFTDNGDNVEVFVTKKYDEATAKRLISNKNIDFWEKDLVPKTISSWFGRKKKCKVVEVGVVKAQEVATNLDRKKYRPLKGGCEIGIQGDNYVGTAGGLVYRRSYGGLSLYGAWESFLYLLRRAGIVPDEEKFILTNCHVAQKNVFDVKQWTYKQPLLGDAIGHINETQQLDPEGDNFIDAAIIKLGSTVDMLPEQIPGWKIKGFNFKVRASDELKKYGRTTSLTTGKLLNTGVTIRVSYRSGSALFRNVYMVTDMSAGGDSGSFVLNQDDEVVGLIFAGGGDRSFVIPIEPVLKRFRLASIYD